MSNKNVKIVIAGGKQDYLIDSLISNHYHLTVISNDKQQCDLLAEKYSNIKIVWGDPSEIYVLTDAGIEDYDILIALSHKDENNLMICQAAKKIFNVKRTVAVVANPKNIEIFRELGIQTVISATHTVANIIEQASIVGDIVNTLSVQDEAVVITKVNIKENSPVVNQQIMNIKMPDKVIISCIIRPTGIVVPNGQTPIMVGDKLLIMSEPSLQKKIVEVFAGKE